MGTRAASAIHSAATDHGELMTLVAKFVDDGRWRRSVRKETLTLRRRQRSSI